MRVISNTPSPLRVSAGIAPASPLSIAVKIDRKRGFVKQLDKTWHNETRDITKEHPDVSVTRNVVEEWQVGLSNA
jgi:hypothetical protein